MTENVDSFEVGSVLVLVESKESDTKPNTFTINFLMLP